MRTALLALAFVGCTERGESPPDAPTPQPASCTELGCAFEDLEDPHCTLTGAECRCDAGPCAWTEPLTTCQRLEVTTEPAADIGEVRVDVRMFTPGVSFTCDGITTWSQYARRMNGAAGTYGRIDVGSTVCEWRDAIETRTPATGACP